MSFWLLLAAFIVLGFGRLYLVDVFGRWSARRDAARFALDPRDRHRSVFHRQRLTWRGAVLTVLTAASWAPADAGLAAAERGRVQRHLYASAQPGPWAARALRLTAAPRGPLRPADLLVGGAARHSAR